MSKEAIIRKSRRIEKETHIPTLHIKRKNGIKKITVEWSSLLICHLGSVKSNSRNLRGDCHEPWVDTWDRIQKNRKMPFSYHTKLYEPTLIFIGDLCGPGETGMQSGFTNWFHRWFSLAREGWWAAQAWESGARCGAKKLISLASTLIIVRCTTYNLCFLM